MQYLHDKQINGYIPDNRFRSRDPKFQNQKDKYGKRHQNLPVKGWKDTLPANEFQFDPVSLSCVCPNRETLTYRGQREAENGKIRVHFEGRLLQCRHCPKKHQCMQNPASAEHRNGAGRQVSFTLENKRQPLDAAILALTASKEPKLMAEHWNGDNRPADGRYKNFRNQALETARNRVFLQPRYQDQPQKRNCEG